MKFRGRRTRAGFPVAVLIAALAAVFSSRAQRNRAPESAPVDMRNAPAVSVPTVPTPVQPTAAGSAPRGGRSPGFASRQRLVEHYEKHGSEFPGLSIDAYLAAAQALRDAPVSEDVLEARRRDGVVTRFDLRSGAFLAANRDGTIRTFFRPNDGERYFRRQASREPGGGP